MQGLLLIDKPSGWSSFDAVNYVRRVIAKAVNKNPRGIKVGHSGTLDPFATGLLILLIGKEYTKRSGKLTGFDKVYEATAYLGSTSSTGDPEGTIFKFSDKVPLTAEIEDVLNQYSGTILQTPPAYSAIKVGGQRAYKLARAGKSVDLKPRKVTINYLKLKNYNYPRLELETSVSSGTYIRSLVEDIGNSLNTGAYTETLRRTKIGDFSVENAVKPKDLIVERISLLQ